MDNIILKNPDGSLTFTNTYDLLESMQEAWGCGLPDREWMEANFDREAVNGTLVYDPDTFGGFKFTHTNPGAENFYALMGGWGTDPVPSAEAVPYMLSALKQAGIMGEVEVEALLNRYGAGGALPEVTVHIQPDGSRTGALCGVELSGTPDNAGTLLQAVVSALIWCME